VKGLSADQATAIAYTTDVLGLDYFSASTKSALLAFQLQEDENGNFGNPKSIFVSSLVYRKVSEKFMAQLWIAMLRRGSDGGLVFEDYACRILTGEAMDVKVHNCSGKAERDNGTYSFLPLGGARKFAGSTILLRKPGVHRTFCFVRLMANIH
jgi:hypothetical protein